MHPAIGQLINGRYYAFIEGHEQQPFEGTLEAVSYTHLTLPTKA